MFKLDIDVASLEASIMTEIERDSKLTSCIAEIAYEQHYGHVAPVALILRHTHTSLMVHA